MTGISGNTGQTEREKPLRGGLRTSCGVVMPVQAEEKGGEGEERLYQGVNMGVLSTQRLGIL